MTAELAQQIKQLFEDKDQQSIRYILGGENAESVEKLSQLLPSDMATALRTLFEQLPKEEEYEIQDQQDQAERNRRIDLHLQQEQLEQKNESFLQMISKVNQKLIYEQHFGFPFYDLCKRILLTHGDMRPLLTTIKTVHSQVQILYSTLFSKEVLEWLSENYTNLTIGFRQFLSRIFAMQCQKYFKFHHVYRHIKKQAAEQQNADQDQNQQQNKQMSLDEDQTLDMDQKQFLVNLSDSVQEFQQFQKNRSYNFLCFGLRKYQTYIGLGPAIYSQIRERQFCQLLSFLSIRFVRKILFTIIREKGGGKLAELKESITSQQIKQIGNQIVDIISTKINEQLSPIRTIQQSAKELFLSEFEPYQYKDFIPRKAFTDAKISGEPLAQYVWKICKDYKIIWSQRIKAQNFFKNGGVRPLTADFLKYIQAHKQKYLSDSGRVWKEFIMIKFGFEIEQKIIPRKRMKLDSLND